MRQGLEGLTEDKKPTIMKIALAQINTTIGDFDGNTSKIFQYIDRACQRGCDLVIFPELSFDNAILLIVTGNLDILWTIGGFTCFLNCCC